MEVNLMRKKTYLVYKALQVTVPWTAVIEAESERDALEYAKAHEKELKWKKGQRSVWDTHWDVLMIDKPLLSPCIEQLALH